MWGWMDGQTLPGALHSQPAITDGNGKHSPHHNLKMCFAPKNPISAVKAMLGFLPMDNSPQPSPLLCRCASNSISCAPVLSFTRTGASCKFYSLPWREMPFRVDHSPVYFYGPIFLNWGFILGLRPRFCSLPQAIQCSKRRNAHVGGGGMRVCVKCVGGV